MKLTRTVNLKETYVSTGEHTFKVVADPTKDVAVSSIEVLDALGLQIKTDIRRWGNKHSCTFKIDSTTTEGVAVVKVHLSSSDNPHVEIHKFWVIK